EQVVAISFAYLVGFDHHVAEPRPRWDVDFHLFSALLALLCKQRLISLDARLALGVTRFRRHANPFQLAFQRLLARALGFLFAAHAFLFLLQPRRIIPFPRDALPAIQF